MRQVLYSINIRSAVLTALGTTLLLSLVCSLSLQAGGCACKFLHCRCSKRRCERKKRFIDS